LHLSVFRTTDDAHGQPQAEAEELMAVFVSFAAPPSCDGYDHCCKVDADIGPAGLHQPVDPGSVDGSCSLGPPAWRCYGAGGAGWALGQPVASVNYEGPLANSRMAAGGRSVRIELGDAADLSVPLTNTYAEHRVRDSSACRALCAAQQQAPGRRSLFADPHAAGCELAGAPRFRAKAGYGRISVGGFGRVSGQRMMRGFDFKNRSIWSQPAKGALNGYGSVVGGFKTLADAEAHTRWRVMSGLVELSSAAAADPARGVFAVDVSQITVGWGCVRGDGGVRLQFPRVPLDGGHGVADSNQAARLHDVKTPGTWLGASDGPRVTADGSRVSFSYNHHADDNFKVDSSGATYAHITLLSGNIGSAIELGTYGLGVRGNAVRDSTVTGVYIHRITQALNPDGSSQEDNLGSVLGSRTCPFGITFENISISDVYIPRLGGANAVGRLFALGTLGAPGGGFDNRSNLDRWFFCNNAWWRQEGDFEQKIQAGGAAAATFKDVRLLNWQVHAAPQARSLLYNYHPPARTSFDGISFYDAFVPGAAAEPGGFPWPWAPLPEISAETVSVGPRKFCIHSLYQVFLDPDDICSPPGGPTPPRAQVDAGLEALQRRRRPLLHHAVRRGLGRRPPRRALLDARGLRRRRLRGPDPGAGPHRVRRVQQQRLQHLRAAGDRELDILRGPPVPIREQRLGGAQPSLESAWRSHAPPR
jgi:hypothetical protein